MANLTDKGNSTDKGQGKEDMFVSIASEQPNVSVSPKWTIPSNDSTGGGFHPKLSKPTVVNNRMIRNQTQMSLSGHNIQAVVIYVEVSNAPGSNDNNITHPNIARQIRHSDPPQMRFDGSESRT